MPSTFTFCKKKKTYPQIQISQFYPSKQFKYIHNTGIDFLKQLTETEKLSLQRMRMFEQITIQQRRKIQLQLRSENHRQTKNSTFSKYRTIIMNQVRKSKLEQQLLPQEDNTPTEAKESLNKLREYFEKQEQQKKRIQTRSLRYITNKTPGQSPRGYKSPQQKDFIPYLSYRRIELIHLKPLKFSDTLKSFQTHKKTMSSQL